MAEQYIDLTPQNLAEEHLCCIIRAKPNPGIAAKRTWLSARLVEGHVFRKLDVKDCVFIEYAPLETAWVPVVGDNWLYIYCLWVASTQKGHGYGSALLASCIEDARRQGKSGVCMLGAQKQKAWLSDQSFARRFGFETVDATPDGYELLALRLDGADGAAMPCFAPSVMQRIDDKGLAVYYDSSARSSPHASRFYRSIAQRRAYPPALSRWTASRRQNRSPVCSTTGRCFTAAPFRRSISLTSPHSNAY